MLSTMMQMQYERDIDRNIATLSNSYDDDDCTIAVEFLGRAGRAALPKLHRLLTMTEYEAATECEPSERVCYVAKAIQIIGAPESVPHLARHFEELGELENPPTAAMLRLAEAMKMLDPGRTSHFPPKPGFMMSDRDAALPSFREAVGELRKNLSGV